MKRPICMAEFLPQITRDPKRDAILERLSPLLYAWIWTTKSLQWRYSDLTNMVIDFRLWFLYDRSRPDAVVGSLTVQKGRTGLTYALGSWRLPLLFCFRFFFSPYLSVSRLFFQVFCDSYFFLSFWTGFWAFFLCWYDVITLRKKNKLS